MSAALEDQRIDVSSDPALGAGEAYRQLFGWLGHRVVHGGERFTRLGRSRLSPAGRRPVDSAARQALLI